MAKAVKMKVVKSSARSKSKTSPKKKETSKKVVALEASTKKEVSKKPVSQKLIETIERRKALQAGGAKPAFGAPPKRRGRRPKNIEYTPENREDEESFSSDSEFESIENDTGIRVQERSAEDRSFSFERFEEFDEELNFDW